MPTVFQTFKTQNDSATGKRVFLLDAKGKQIPHKYWRAQINWHDGSRKSVSLSTSKTESQKMADAIQTREDEIRRGLRPAPHDANRHSRRPFVDVVREYLDWGNTQGGRNHGPWSPVHARSKERNLSLWTGALGLSRLGDIYGTLPKVEAECRRLLSGGLAGKTMTQVVEVLRSFIAWCQKRKYLTEDPLENLGRFDTTPKTTRRASTVEEVSRLLSSCAPHRRLLYEVALGSGLRGNELRQLTPAHLDREQCKLKIDRAWDKGRKDRLQPIPSELMRRLVEFAESGEVRALYERCIEQQGSRAVLKGIPENPLLYVPRNTAAMLRKDLKRAGIPYTTEAGNMDFHSLRVTYITNVVKSGADLKTAQTLARHSDSRITMNVYAKSQDSDCRAAADAVGRMIYGDKDCTTRAQPDEDGHVKEQATADYVSSCLNKEWSGRRESNPRNQLGKLELCH